MNNPSYTDETFTSVVHFSNGNVLHKIFDNYEGSLVGEKEFSPTGVLIREVILTIRYGLRYEERKIYYDNHPHTVKFVKNYVRGIPHGDWIGYHQNGGISYFVNYVNGNKRGDELHYDNQGIITSRRNYE